MPKLPVLSGKDIINILERLGFNVTRQKGSHVILKRVTPSGTRGCVVPLHREVKRATLGGVLKQAGITPDEFLEAFMK